MAGRTGAGGPRRLVEWPWVVVEVECEPCRYHAGYRLARLAEKFGAEADLAGLLDRVRVKCRLIDRGAPRRHPVIACSIRYRVPAGGPLPDGALAREAVAGERWPPRPKRLGPQGPPPTIGSTLAEGCTAVLVYCAGRGCHHQGRIEIDDLALPLDWPFTGIARARRLWCTRCGSREVDVRPDRPDPREVQARRMSGVTTPGCKLNGIVVQRYADEPTAASSEAGSPEPGSRQG